MVLFRVHLGDNHIDKHSSSCKQCYQSSNNSIYHKSETKNIMLVFKQLLLTLIFHVSSLSMTPPRNRRFPNLYCSKSLTQEK